MNKGFAAGYCALIDIEINEVSMPDTASHKIEIFRAGTQPALSRARDDASASHQPGWDQTEARKHCDGADHFTTQQSGYAEKRGLDPAFLRRDSDHVQLDRSGNLLMAHWDSTATLTGYEIKGAAFEGFATDGARSVFAIGSPQKPMRGILLDIYKA